MLLVVIGYHLAILPPIEEENVISSKDLKGPLHYNIFYESVKYVDQVLYLAHRGKFWEGLKLF